MSDIEAQIQQAASKNAQLLSVLGETDHAPPDLQQQLRYINDLESQAANSDKKIKTLDSRREKELKEHESYRDSHMKRFMFKAAGKKEKFAEKADKEEREYFEVLQESHQEQEFNANVKMQLNEAYQARDNLSKEAERHNSAQQELDHLYNSIFAGPTPQFPDEDKSEEASNRALQSYHDCRMKWEAESNAVKLLSSGMKAMHSSINEMDGALSCSRMDMFGGGTMTDMMERSHLSKAQQMQMQAQMFVTRAQKASPFVGDLPNVNINQGHLMSDVFFDNIFTDMQFHDEIKRSRVTVVRCAQAMDAQLSEAKSRHQGLSGELNQRGQELEQARIALQKSRERAFEKVIGDQKQKQKQ